MKKRILMISVLCFVFSTMVNAQAFQWAKQFASSYSWGSDVVTDNDLNVISAGWFRDSVDMDPNMGTHWVYENSQSSNYNAYLNKLDSNGQFVWGHSYQGGGTYSYTRLLAVDVDNQDNILVLGHFRDSVDLDFGSGVFKLYDNNFNNNSYWDNLFVAKYDPAGNFIWGKHFYTTHNINNYGLWGHGLKVDGANNVIISGRFRDTVDFDPGPGTYNLVGQNNSNTYYGDKFLLKLTSAGNFNWVRRWTHTGWGNNNNGWWGSNELDVDANDNIFMPMIYSDSLDIDPELPVDMIYTQGLRDISLLKISPSGTLVWHKEIGGAGHDYCHSLATDPSGNIFYSIQTYSNPIDMDPGPGSYMLNWSNNNWGKAILKLDNNGNFIWALKNLDHNNTSGWWGGGIATDTSGSLYLSTRIHPNTFNNNQWDLDPGPGAYIVSSVGSWDIAFQNLDGNGQFVWGGVIGGSSADYSWHMCTDKARGVYLTGYFNNQADFDPTPDTNFMTSTPTSYDAFVVKLNNCNRATTQIVQSCDSVFYNNQYYYQDTIFQSHYAAFNGCDSAHSIFIDVKQLANDTIVVDTCKFYVWNNTLYTTSGFYTHNYGIPNGCDSIVTLDLTIYNEIIQVVNLADCDSAVFNGISYTQTGQYQQQYNSVYGCDSNIIINFTNSIADTSITVNSPVQLTANAVGATYQWIDCSTMLPILGATNALFTFSQSGSYACVVTQNNCTDTSSCYQMDVTPADVVDYKLVSKLYPNPSKGTYHLELDKNYKDVQLEIRNMKGQVVWKKEFESLKNTEFKIGRSSGVYMLYIKIGERQEMKKLLKW